VDLVVAAATSQFRGATKDRLSDLTGKIMSQSEGVKYYLPGPSSLPLAFAASLFVFFVGAGRWLHDFPDGPTILFTAVAFIALVLSGWFGTVIHENRTDCYTPQVGCSFRTGMRWLIFTEVVFFSAFFAALFYTRLWSLPELGGAWYPLTNILLWPDFNFQWPLLDNPDNSKYLGATHISSPWDIPLVNTLLLLTSACTLVWAQWGLSRGSRWILKLGLLLTILLGVSFLLLQANEYYGDYTRDGLTLNAGIYGSLFFFLTGFHGLHVAAGVVMLSVMLGRSLAGHFTPENHFALEGVGWYWHFVDVVWLLLFVFVYWL
jgi:cytochrome c oxidase subunit 3